MSLRGRKPSEQQDARFTPWTHRAAASAVEPTDSWWTRKQVQKQQPLPRLQLYTFDTSQAVDELYAFLYDRKEVRHFYSQSRINGQRMGELEAVEGYGRADIMAIAWTRKGGADFEVEFIGHNMLNLANGYIIKSDVRGVLSWVPKLTRLYGEHIMSLTSSTLLSLPTYTALATGLKFGLEDPRGGHGSLAVAPSAEPAPEETPTAAQTEGFIDIGLNAAFGPSEELDRLSLRPAHTRELGRCEVGSHFSHMATIDEAKGVKANGGDKWSIVRPWDNNHSIGAVASFEAFTPMTAPSGKAKTGVRCSPKIKDAPVGVIFPIRGEPDMEDGQYVHRIEIEATPVTESRGVQASHKMSVYRAYLYNDAIGGIIGVADVIPDVRRSADGKTMKASRFIATPALGKKWIGDRPGDEITVEKADADRCVQGGVAPWSMDLVCVVEAAIYKLGTGGV